MSIEPIPQGFLSKLLQEFGLQWTHLVILSGVAFSSFRLENYLNPGVWILGTISSFSLVYLFRREISGNFPRYAFWASVTTLMGFAFAFFGLRLADQSIAEFAVSHTIPATLYVSLIVAVPVGVCILSYRAQDDFVRSPLPESLGEAIAESVTSCEFINERVEYEVDLIPDPQGRVKLKFLMRIVVVNRTQQSLEWRDIFDPAGVERRFFLATIKGRTIDHTDPDRLSVRGLVLQYKADAGESFDVVVEAESVFYARDSEIVTSYLPTGTMIVRLKTPPNNIRVNVQSLYRHKIDPVVTAEGESVYEFAHGVLPFQGTRIFWEPSVD